MSERKTGGKIKVGYWKIRGLGAPIRMLLDYAGAFYEDKQYTDSKEWFEQDKPAMLTKNPLANLPYIDDGGIIVCQANACIEYLGDRYGLNGKTPEERRLCKQMLCEIYDLRNTVVNLVYPHNERCRSKDEFQEKMVRHLSTEKAGVKAAYSKLENVYALSVGSYCCGADITTADFHIWEMLDQHEAYANMHGQPSPLTDYPKLAGFYEAFRRIPQLQTYFSGEKYKLDCNAGISYTAGSV